MSAMSSSRRAISSDIGAAFECGDFAGGEFMRSSYVC
ncbi:hypothetical protein A2U01_0056498 [Trifolium medium]|uniref:Uncharacterized protein n=1 Tax=Trifolium medium TaxID=97028 RepID=A0A392RGD8_9FABA|nr:hypothetical protein [Trifolium medium]